MLSRTSPVPTRRLNQHAAAGRSPGLLLREWAEVEEEEGGGRESGESVTEREGEREEE